LHGHDAFLMPDVHYHNILRSYLQKIEVWLCKTQCKIM
jgi:homoserine O-acetyltransferase